MPNQIVRVEPRPALYRSINIYHQTHKKSVKGNIQFDHNGNCYNSNDIHFIEVDMLKVPLIEGKP